MPKLLTLGASQPKAVKGEKKGYLTAVLHLAPHTSAAVQGNSGKVINICPHADGCEVACLNTAGHGGIIRKGESTNAVQEARKARTRLLFSDRAAFANQLNKEISLFAHKAAKRGMGAALRLNGTSDLDFDGILPGTVALAESLGLHRYDYTKVPGRAKRKRATSAVRFSLSAGNDEAAGDWLRNGGNVAVVFRTADLPTTYTIDGETRSVINGDDSDLRFLDDTGVIVGLKAKGKARLLRLCPREWGIGIMANLPAIVRAARASARAWVRMQTLSRKLRPMHAIGNRAELQRAYQRAARDYQRAQDILARNPL